MMRSYGEAISIHLDPDLGGLDKKLNHRRDNP